MLQYIRITLLYQSMYIQDLSMNQNSVYLYMCSHTSIVAWSFLVGTDKVQVQEWFVWWHRTNVEIIAKLKIDWKWSTYNTASHKHTYMYIRSHHCKTGVFTPAPPPFLDFPAYFLTLYYVLGLRMRIIPHAKVGVSHTASRCASSQTAHG